MELTAVQRRIGSALPQTFLLSRGQAGVTPTFHWILFEACSASQAKPGRFLFHEDLLNGGLNGFLQFQCSSEPVGTKQRGPPPRHREKRQRLFSSLFASIATQETKASASCSEGSVNVDGRQQRVKETLRLDKRRFTTD